MLRWIQAFDSLPYQLSLLQQGLTKEELDLKRNQYLEPLQISIPLELLFTAPARRARHLTRTPGHLHNLLEGLAVSTPPSHLGGDNLQE
jgi:hypothetical protein